MITNTRHIFDLTPDDLAALVSELKLPAYRAKQVLEWVYGKGAGAFDVMTNLSKRDRELLSERLHILSGRIVAEQSATDGVRKLLIDWNAESKGLPVLGKTDTQTECVMIPSDDRKTACISSQIGCPVGCKFCASGLGGLDGNLTSGQIIEQVWRLGRLPEVGRITNVVFMGMGEPLANFDAVTQAVRTLTAEWGLGISGRRITISTVGLPAQIRRLADMGVPATLAISLHAPNDSLRRELIPWAEYVTIEQLLDAGRYYFDQTGREITLEYILLRNVNDRPEHAHELAAVAHTLRSNVNLIRYNEVRDMPFDRPSTTDVHRFQEILRRHGVNSHIRASRGRDIAAACGQLRHEHALPIKDGEAEP